MSLRRAYKAGIPFLSGSETGFAMTPYGEFPARELPVMMRALDIPAGEMLRAATSRNRRMPRGGGGFDSLAAGNSLTSSSSTATRSRTWASSRSASGSSASG